MDSLSDNYYHRKYYLDTNQVPTQSVIKKKMTAPLAKLYFNSMSPRLKVLAGLEPPMQGGGTEWYMPPEEQLAGRAVLKPLEKEYLDLLCFKVMHGFGDKLKNKHYKQLANEKKDTISQNDSDWQHRILENNNKAFADFSIQYTQNNTIRMVKALNCFEIMYRKSLSKLEDTVQAAASKEVERIKEEVYQQMKQRFAQLLKYQSIEMYDAYENNLNKEKIKAKAIFIDKVEKMKTDLANQVHDIYYEKHVAIEKLRHFVQCKNLACQVYVAFKEKEACDKELKVSKHKHKKTVKQLEKQICIKDRMLQINTELNKNHDKLIEIWRKKICHVVKKFQLFVQYCLQQMPEQADFFINIEKLLLLQLSAAIECPNVESNIISEPATISKAPEPNAVPFYLFCDKGYKPQINRDLCPKHVRSSTSQLPVIIINRRCIYSACDNFEMFSDKVRQYIDGNRGEDIEDDYEYETLFPVKYTSNMQLKEIKLESSILQILQNELPNTREVTVNCNVCKLPYCFCKPSASNLKVIDSKTSQTDHTTTPKTVVSASNSIELKLKRIRTWESYSEYTEPKPGCLRAAYISMYEQLPPYMTQISPYGHPDLPNYEICDPETLARLVKKACTIQSSAVEDKPETKDASTQYSDQAFDNICASLCDHELSKFFDTLVKVSKTSPAKLVDGSVSHVSLTKSINSFANARVNSLRLLLSDDPDLEAIFKSKFCE